MATAINNYICEIGPALADKIPASLLDPIGNIVDHDNVLELTTTDESEVNELLISIPDGMPVRYLKEHSEVTVPIVTHIINTSLSTNVCQVCGKQLF